MSDADEADRPLPIDPQPRRDLEVPPMVATPDNNRVASVKSPTEKPGDANNIFAGWVFNGGS